MLNSISKMASNRYPLGLCRRVLVGILSGVYSLTCLLCGCEKVPTFQDLTAQTPSPSVEQANAAPADNQAGNQPDAKVQPEPPDDPQRVIAEFLQKTPQERDDLSLLRLCALPSGLDVITELNLADSSVSDAGLQKLSRLRNLESLDLARTKVTEMGLMATVDVPNLKKLSLANCTLVPEMVQHLGKLKQLETLNLLGTNVANPELSLLGSLSEIRDINLSITQISDDALKFLSSLPNLERLNVDQTPINGDGMQLFKSSKGGKGLRFLSANATQFGLKGMLHLRQIETLEELELHRTGVTSQSLQSLKGMTQLRRLVLGENSIHDGGQPSPTAIFGSMLQLEELSLDQMDGISDRTMSFLTKNKRLKQLNVNRCGGVTEAGGVRPLKKYLPECQISALGMAF